MPDCVLAWHVNCYMSGMNVAVPIWQGRVSPVFDSATVITIVAIEQGCEVRRTQTSVLDPDPMARARQVAREGIDVVICGAISRPLEMALRGAGIRVYANLCGPLEDVLAAFRAGRLEDVGFAMPGCCRRGRRKRQRAGQRCRRSANDPAATERDFEMTSDD